MHAQRVVLVASSGAGMLATFLPWASLGLSASIPGTAGNGWVSFVIFAVVLASSCLGARAQPPSNLLRFGAVFVGLVAALLGIYVLCRVHALADVHIGPGLYLELVASVVVVCAGAWTPSDGDALPGVFAAIVATITVAVGFFHVTYGQNYTGQMLCEKVTWSLADTFVNVNDYIGHQRDEYNARVIDALVKCEALHLEQPPSEGGQPPNSGNPVDVAATELAAAYKANEFSADGSYRNKLVRVTGYVDRVTNEIEGDPRIALRAGDFNEVLCSFRNSASLYGLRSVLPGNKVVLSGIGAGTDGGDPVLLRCNVDEFWSDACQVADGSGTCADVQDCATAGGHAYPGACNGASDIQCCVTSNPQ